MEVDSQSIRSTVARCILLTAFMAGSVAALPGCGMMAHSAPAPAAAPAASNDGLTAPIASHSIAEMLAPLAREYRVRLVHARGEVPRAVWPGVTFDTIDHDSALLAYVRLFDEEFRKYTPAFIRASGLKTVAFVSDLKYAGQERWAVPDFVHETLYLDVGVRFARDEVFQRRVIHHEFYHLLEEEWNGDPYFKDPAWAALNTSDHRYGAGGAANRDRRLSLFNHPAPGFVSRYAMTGLEEDKAEVWAAMFVPELWQPLSAWMEEDAILRAKVEFLETFAREQDAQMDAGYWERVRE